MLCKRSSCLVSVNSRLEHGACLPSVTAPFLAGDRDFGKQRWKTYIDASADRKDGSRIWSDQTRQTGRAGQRGNDKKAIKSRPPDITYLRSGTYLIRPVDTRRVLEKSDGSR